MHPRSLREILQALAAGLLKRSPKGRREGRLSARPRIEELEPRFTPSGFAYDPANKTLIVTGTIFQFAQASRQDANGVHTTYRFTIDGTSQSYADTQLSSVTVNAAGTSPAATLYTADSYTGSDGQAHATAQAVTLWSGGGKLEQRDANGKVSLFLGMNNFPASYAYVGQEDQAEMMGGASDIHVFESHGSYATFSSASDYRFIWGAAALKAFGAQQDYAVQYDGTGSAVFTTYYGFSSMTGTDQGRPFDNIAQGFAFNTGIAQHANDQATFGKVDLGNPTYFIGAPGESYQYSDRSGALYEYEQAAGFSNVTASRTAGQFGNGTADTAAISGGDGPTSLVASGNTYFRVSGTDHGQAFLIETDNFFSNTATSRHAGDSATFYDSPQNDVFVGGTLSSYLYRDYFWGKLAYYCAANGFATVNAYSFVGGYDVAFNSDPTHNFVAGFGVHR